MSQMFIVIWLIVGVLFIYILFDTMKSRKIEQRANDAPKKRAALKAERIMLHYRLERIENELKQLEEDIEKGEKKELRDEVRRHLHKMSQEAARQQMFGK